MKDVGWWITNRSDVPLAGPFESWIEASCVEVENLNDAGRSQIDFGEVLDGQFSRRVSPEDAATRDFIASQVNASTVAGEFATQATHEQSLLIDRVAESLILLGFTLTRPVGRLYPDFYESHRFWGGLDIWPSPDGPEIRVRWRTHEWISERGLYGDEMAALTASVMQTALLQLLLERGFDAEVDRVAIRIKPSVSPPK